MGFRIRAAPACEAPVPRSVERGPGSPGISKGLPRSVAAVAGLLLLAAGPAAAQQVRGRLVSARDGSPVGDALVLLLDSTRHELARTASTGSGGFSLVSPRPGRFTVRVQRIGYVAWETGTPPVEVGGEWVETLRVPDEAYSLPELTVYAEQPLCGVSMGNAGLVARLLETAETALGLAEAAISATDSGLARYTVRTWRQTVRPDGTALEPALATEHASGWPIRSADPESLRTWGFVRGHYPPRPSWTPEAGPTFYGPDARVLFTPWFLDTHCFRIEPARGARDTTLVVRFKPGRNAGAAVLSGRFEFDRATLGLRVLTFAYERMPSWVPPGTGGALRFVRLDDGTWLPAWWRMRAPIPVGDVRRSRYELFGFAETGGYVVTVLRPDGSADEAAGTRLRAARELGPPPP